MDPQHITDRRKKKRCEDIKQIYLNAQPEVAAALISSLQQEAEPVQIRRQLTAGSPSLNLQSAESLFSATLPQGWGSRSILNK